jgi:DNA (cytosine-5)-methyltransferase 1
MDNKQSNDEGLRELALFAGAGGGILGGKLLGWETVCAVEYNAYARSVLLARQNDRALTPFPIWDDVRTFDGKPWRGIVDVVSGGFPCQDISVAGKGAGIEGERSGLWSEMARIICEIRPKYAFIENSPMLANRGLGTVLADLSKMGFDAQWGVLSCADVGGVHLRERIWIVATNTKIMQRNGSAINNQNSQCKIQQSRNNNIKINTSNNRSERGEGVKQKEIYRFARLPWGEDVRGIEDLRNRSDLPEPIIRRIGNDVAFGVDRLKAIGNGQVPLCAATAWRILNETKTI